jgi:transposase
MAKIRTLELTPQQRVQLQDAYQNGKSHAFRKRCHLVLLKTEERTSKEVGQILSMHQVTVNNWLNRYEQEGINGLKTKPGRGRKPILDPKRDLPVVQEAVKEERQRLKQAKEIIENQLDKSFSVKTLKRFLKKTTADTNGFA